MSYTKYFNLKTNYGIETVDHLERKNFNSYKDFKKELVRLKKEYILAGIAVYISQKPCKDY